MLEEKMQGFLNYLINACLAAGFQFSHCDSFILLPLLLVRHNSYNFGTPRACLDLSSFLGADASNLYDVEQTEYHHFSKKSYLAIDLDTGSRLLYLTSCEMTHRFLHTDFANILYIL